jgi:hypothetical protein
MIRNVLQAISGIEIYPVISLMIFFSLFISVLIWFFKVDKAHLRLMEAIPLDKQVNNE